MSCSAERCKGGTTLGDRAKGKDADRAGVPDTTAYIAHRMRFVILQILGICQEVCVTKELSWKQSVLEEFLVPHRNLQNILCALSYGAPYRYLL